MNVRTDWKPKDYFQAEDYNRIRHNFALCYPYGDTTEIDATYIPTFDDIQGLRNWFQVIVNQYNICIPQNEILPWLDFEPFNPDKYPVDGKFPPLGTVYPYIGRSAWFPDAAELNLYGRMCEYVNENFLGGDTND